MPESDAMQHFDALLEAMVKKPPLDISPKEPPADDDDVREPDAD